MQVQKELTLRGCIVISVGLFGQSVGAFWGMVFRFALGYEDKRTVSVVKEKNFGIQTASRFCMLEDKRRENLVID